MNGRVL